MTMRTSEVVPVSLGKLRSRTDLMLEIVALRHQIAVLKRSGTRRPCFGLWDRLFWILLSWWWPRWPESLMIIQPETVRRWRRNGWWGLRRYRSRGRWRGGRPRVSQEIRELITRMARENFLWGAPRIHGEVLMLRYEVSQATVSRYLATLYRHPGQSWRTLIRNQAFAFSYRNDLDYGDQNYQGLVDCGSRDKFTGSAEQMARQEADSRRWYPTRGVTARAGWRTRGGRLRTFRCDTAPDRSLTGARIHFQSQCRCEVRRIAPGFLKAGGSQNRRELRGPGFEKRQAGSTMAPDRSCRRGHLLRRSGRR